MLVLFAGPARAQTNFSLIKIFGVSLQDGALPGSGVIQGGDGAFYGTTIAGPGSGYGVAYRHSPEGTHTILHSFSGAVGDGRAPRFRLVEGNDGALYGTTETPVTGDNHGTIFKVNKDGSGYSILHKFGMQAGDGRIPEAGLLQSWDGSLYGTTGAGGTNNRGTIFSISLDGSSYNILYHFKPAGLNDGRSPFAPLIQATDGMLYGTTRYGGSNDVGTVFRLNPDGTGYERIYSFRTTGGDGTDPLYAGVSEGPDGALYGTTYAGGTAGFGTLYRLTKSGDSYLTLRSFGTSGNDARHPMGVLAHADGFLYGTATDGGGTSLYGVVFRYGYGMPTPYLALHTFGSDSRNPNTGLIEGWDGFLYGTCQTPVTNNGSIFRVAKDGSSYDLVHGFGLVTRDSAASSAPLVQASQGMLYGTATLGGISNAGTIFTVRNDGTDYSILHSFIPSTDGRSPRCALLEASDGLLYGTTTSGGQLNQGTVFQMSLDGSFFSVLHHFGTREGTDPEASLIEASDGMLYGTTCTGGNGQYVGTIFSIAKDGSAFTLLRTFTNGAGDATYPYGSLVEASDGALYGTASRGGTGDMGAIFRINKDGSDYGLIHSFATNRTEGVYPRSSLLLTPDGSLYGTADTGGLYEKGTIFRLNTDGSGFRVLHQFGSVTPDGTTPTGALALSGDDVLYGTTQYGGTANNGTVFRMNRDGSEYAVVKHFTSATTSGLVPRGGVIIGDDGALYGSTYGGGLNSGVLFRLVRPQRPSVSQPLFVSNKFQLTLSGTPSYNHVILRSTNLTTWSTVATTNMPGAGTLIYQDPSPPRDKAFYRATWIP